MGELAPIIGVVAFWMIVGIIACTMFGRWLKAPTVEEEEAAEHAKHEAEAAAAQEQENVGAKAAH